VISLEGAAWSSAATWRGVVERSAAIATERASLGSFLFELPAANSRTRAPKLGCTSKTAPSTPTSCWANNGAIGQLRQQRGAGVGNEIAAVGGHLGTAGRAATIHLQGGLLLGCMTLFVESHSPS